MQDMGGERLEVLLAPSEDELMEVQAKARALGLPTHTFAGGVESACSIRTIAILLTATEPVGGGRERQCGRA